MMEYVAEGRRTEIQTGQWLQCYRCRKPTLAHELVARVDVTTVGRNIIGLPVIRYEGIVAVCPTCEAQQQAADASKRKWQGLALGCAALSFFCWQYVGGIGYWVALGVLAIGAVWRRFGRQRQLVIWRKQ